MTEAAKKTQKRESVAALRKKLAFVTAQLNKHVTVNGAERVNRSHTTLEKLVAVGRVAAGEKAVDVAKKLDITPSALSKWVKKATDAVADKRGAKGE